MRRYPNINLSWRKVIIAISFYALFLTGFSLGAHSIGPSTSSAAVLTAEDVPPVEESLLVIGSAQAEEPEAAASDEPLVPQAVVYCTHTSEGYYGQERQNGVAGGVLDAARSLRDALEANGIGVILLEEVFDAPDWNNSYGYSLAAVEEVKAQYPDIQLYIDVHRDAEIPGVDTHFSDDSGSYARMMRSIGSNANLPHPNWEQNRAFADQLYNELESSKPGLMRDSKIYNGRYNQHVGNKAILVEIGSTSNTVEEAKASATLLGNAIAKLL